MNLKKISVGALIALYISLAPVLPIYGLTSDNNKVIIAELTDEMKSVDARYISKQSLSRKESPRKTSSRLDAKNINIYNDGTIRTKLILHNNKNKKEVINLNGTLLYDPNNKNQILAKATINNKNYEVVHLSISKEGNKSTVSGRRYTCPTMNIYLKNRTTDDIEFYEIDINNSVFSKINKIKNNLEVASLEDAYWFVNVTEPEHEVTQEEDTESISPRIARIRSIVGYSTLTWSYKNGEGGTSNIKSQFKINLTIDQSGDTVYGNARVMSFTHTENGVPLKYNGTYGLTRIKAKWGSEQKINRLLSVGTTGNFISNKPPVYIKFSAIKKIAPGVTIGIQPSYSSSPVKTYPFLVDGYQAAFEAKSGSSYFQMQSAGHQIDSGIKLYSGYAGKNITYQIDFTHKHGVYSKNGSLNAYAPLRTASQTN